MNKLKKGLVSGVLIVSIGVTSIGAYAEITNTTFEGVLLALKNKIISYVTVDTTSVKAEYDNMTKRINEYIGTVNTDAKNEIESYKEQKNKEEIDNIKIKEEKIKSDLLKAKNEAVASAKTKIDTQVKVDIENYDNNVNKQMLDTINSLN